MVSQDYYLIYQQRKVNMKNVTILQKCLDIIISFSIFHGAAILGRQLDIF